jgi:hypothetical protein
MRTAPHRILSWQDRLKLIGDLMEISRAATRSGIVTPQQRKRATIVKRRLRYNKDPKSAPLISR